MDEQTQLLREMRDLLKVIAEPLLAQRDKSLRAALREVVGKGTSKANAVRLMDGSRNQAAICKEAAIDDGNLSRLIKALRSKELLNSNEQKPQLVISIPRNFFEQREDENG